VLWDRRQIDAALDVVFEKEEQNQVDVLLGITR